MVGWWWGVLCPCCQSSAKGNACQYIYVCFCTRVFMRQRIDSAFSYDNASAPAVLMPAGTVPSNAVAAHVGPPAYAELDHKSLDLSPLIDAAKAAALDSGGREAAESALQFVDLLQPDDFPTDAIARLTSLDQAQALALKARCWAAAHASLLHICRQPGARAPPRPSRQQGTCQTDAHTTRMTCRPLDLRCCRLL